MRAYGVTALGGPENEAMLDVPVPEPAPGELLVRVRAAGVNPGDWKLREGGYGDVALPAVLGREVAGTVVATGPGVEGFAVGDEVFGGTPGMVGGWAEFALVTASFAAHRPERVAPADAATLPVAPATAYDALTGLDLERGSTLLVNGAGDVLHVGRRSRSVSRRMRRALNLRDRHCQAPGCRMPAQRCEPHHLQHWIDNGPTVLPNLRLYCNRHHGQLHPENERFRRVARRPDVLRC